jgi:hypothetical protein
MFLIPTGSSFQDASTDPHLQAQHVSEASPDPFKVSQSVLKSSDYLSLSHSYFSSIYPPSTSSHQPSRRRYAYSVNELIALQPTPSRLPRQLRRKIFLLHIWKPKRSVCTCYSCKPFYPHSYQYSFNLSNVCNLCTFITAVRICSAINVIHLFFTALRLLSFYISAIELCAWVTSSAHTDTSQHIYQATAPYKQHIGGSQLNNLDRKLIQFIQTKGDTTCACDRGNWSGYEQVQTLRESNSSSVLVSHVPINTNIGSQQDKTRERIMWGLLNARSICNKSEAIIDFIATHKLSILAVCETWLTGSDIYDQTVITSCSPIGFTTLNWPRSHKRGGGLMVLYDEKLSLKKNDECFNTLDLKSTVLEYGLFQVVCYCDTITCCLIYRPPGANLSQFFSIFTKMCEILLKFDQLIIMGDFNLPQKQFEEDSSFMSIITAFQLQQLVREATHESGHTLDLIITRMESRYLGGQVHIVEGISDHKGILVEAETCISNESVQSTIDPVKTIRNFKLFEINAFCLAVHDEVVNPILVKFANPQNIWEPLSTISSSEFSFELNRLLSLVLNRFAPWTEINIKKGKRIPWWNFSCQENKKQLRRLERTWRKMPLTVNREIYLRARKEYHLHLTSVRSEFIKKRIIKFEDEPRKYWQLVNSLLGRERVKVLPNLPEDTLADNFNKYFNEKITKIRESIVVPQGNVEYQHYQVLQMLLSFGDVTGADVVSCLRSMSLKPNKLDILPTWLFKSTSQVLMPVLVCWVNCILKNGLPEHYKHSIITPLMKSKTLNPNELCSYRPVANFPTLVKIVEKLISHKIMSHLERNNLLDPFQSAYRTDHSCETVILSILNDVYTAIDRGEITLLIMLDMSAAFDTVDHGLLLRKLECLGIGGDALQWLKNYLNNRAHSTEVCGKTSDSLPLTMGVPQGSVLGPLLFTIYIRDLGELIQELGFQYYIYADDTQFMVNVKPSEISHGIKKIEDGLIAIEQWTSRNFLKLNPSKLEIIALGNKEQLKKIPNSDIIINGKTFTLKPVVRNLGVWIDCGLKFRQHVDKICRTAYSNLRSLHHLRRSLSNSQLSKFVHALVLSHIEWCPAVLYGIEKNSAFYLRLSKWSVSQSN